MSPNQTEFHYRPTSRTSSGRALWSLKLKLSAFRLAQSRLVSLNKCERPMDPELGFFLFLQAGQTKSRIIQPKYRGGLFPRFPPYFAQHGHRPDFSHNQLMPPKRQLHATLLTTLIVVIPCLANSSTANHDWPNV